MSDKFEVGDLVELTGNFHDPDEIGYMALMDELVGKRLTIEKIYKKNSPDRAAYKIKECKDKFWYSEYWLEYYEKPFELGEELFTI